jgi:DNA-binding NtrC family response regulator
LSKNNSILIAEDESIIALDMINMLEKSGYTDVSLVRDGEALFNKVLKDPPSLIIMDIFLRGKESGLETAQKIWGSHNIPIVFISGMDNDDFNKQINFTRCDFIKKPFKESDLITAVKKFL